MNQYNLFKYSDFIPLFFSPNKPQKNEENFSKLIEFIKLADKSIQICMYAFTHRKIADTIVKLFVEKNVKVQIIGDKSQSDLKRQNKRYRMFNGIKFNRLKWIKFKAKQIQIRRNIASYKLMHSKIIIIDGKYIATGSFNFSKQAVNRNVENILLIKNYQLAQLYTHNFKEIWGNNKDFQDLDIKNTDLSGYAWFHEASTENNSNILFKKNMNRNNNSSNSAVIQNDGKDEQDEFEDDIENIFGIENIFDDEKMAQKENNNQLKICFDRIKQIKQLKEELNKEELQLIQFIQNQFQQNLESNMEEENE